MFDVLPAVVDGQGQYPGPFSVAWILAEGRDAGRFGAGVDGQGGLVDFFRRDDVSTIWMAKTYQRR